MSGEFRGKPSITLTGFMFSGKSRVGRELAGRLGLRFVDLDSEIERAAGTPVGEIFAVEGESGFRRLEREAVARVLPHPGQVVAAGGGAVVDPDNLALIAGHSCVVWLKVAPQTVLERWKQSKGRLRPLLQVDDPEREIIRLMQERRSFYQECDFSVECDGLTVEEAAGAVLERLDTGATGQQ
ncbi:MAG: shikimate kinase [Candidatus Glassbacteria bacterium]|nr:shikimate kinase [Candidatus Glassbacteria bacterium]